MPPQKLKLNLDALRIYSPWVTSLHEVIHADHLKMLQSQGKALPELPAIILRDSSFKLGILHVDSESKHKIASIHHTISYRVKNIKGRKEDSAYITHIDIWMNCLIIVERFLMLQNLHSK